MSADSRDVDVDAPIRVQHRHGAAPEAAVVHLRTDREIGRAAATEQAARRGFGCTEVDPAAFLQIATFVPVVIASEMCACPNRELDQIAERGVGMPDLADIPGLQGPACGAA
jgi:hypothetical protein